MTLSTLWFNYI